MYGYHGQYLRINLNTKKVLIEKQDVEVIKKFIGGRGWGTKSMMDEMDPKVGALSPENKLMIVTGPFTSMLSPVGGRYTVLTKCPSTEMLTSLNAGGDFGAELKRAGYDMLIFENASEEPVFVSILDDQICILPASHLWNQEACKANAILRDEYGENAKMMAVSKTDELNFQIMLETNSENQSEAWSGIGAVMNSKNLKAIVVQGSGEIEIKDDRFVKEANRKCIAKFREKYVTGESLVHYEAARDRGFDDCMFFCQCPMACGCWNDRKNNDMMSDLWTNFQRSNFTELEHKASRYKTLQDMSAVIDSMGLCLFTLAVLRVEDYTRLINSVCGTNYTCESILEVGERIWNLEKLFHLEAGIDPANHVLPKFVLETFLNKYSSDETEQRLDSLLICYHELRGWTRGGIPTDERLATLGLL